MDIYSVFRKNALIGTSSLTNTVIFSTVLCDTYAAPGLPVASVGDEHNIKIKLMILYFILPYYSPFAF